MEKNMDPHNIWMSHTMNQNQSEKSHRFIFWKDCCFSKNNDTMRLVNRTFIVHCHLCMEIFSNATVRHHSYNMVSRVHFCVCLCTVLSKFWLYLFKTLLEAAPWCHRHLRFTNICSSYHTYPSNTSYCLTLRLYDTNSWNPVLFECIQGLLIVSMTAHQTVFNYSFDKNFHSKPVFSNLLIVIETIDRSQFYAWHFWIRVYIWVLIGRHRTQMYVPIVKIVKTMRL